MVAAPAMQVETVSLTAKMAFDPPAVKKQPESIWQKEVDEELGIRDWRLNYLFEGTGFVMCPIFLLELPAAIILGYQYRELFSYHLMLPMFCLYLWKECIPMSVCLHRFFSHRGWKCNNITQFGLYILGCLASQGPPLWWASKHRRHHAHCDTDLDPHSPITTSKLYAWLGWVYLPGKEGPTGRGVDEDFIKDHLKFPELVWAENVHWVPIWLVHYLFYVYGGVAYAVYVSLWSGVLCQLLTLYFNVMFHSHEADGVGPGLKCKALDLPLDPLAQLFGEAYHKWHHENPSAFKRKGLDLPYWIFVWPALQLGIFWTHRAAA